MQIKIVKTIDIEDVPNEIDNNIEDVVEKIMDIWEFCKALPYYDDHKNADVVLEKLEELRKRLIKIDSAIEDCQSIIVGHKKIMDKLESGEEVEESADQSDSR